MCISNLSDEKLNTFLSLFMGMLGKRCLGVRGEGETGPNK